ncbi:MAG: hypothetical protein DHS20C08_03520 [Rhodomicrobium sp.]|nr:MAG: hypothetical protein DHS20C08_03520 [Rhodomicrobium sp.]
MTRRTLNRHLCVFVTILLVIIAIAGAAKFAPVFGFNQRWVAKLYEFINDMSLLIFTIGAAYLANMFQRRASFISGLRDEWHEIVRAKSSLICYIDNPDRSMTDYLHAYQHLSQCIDYMRIVYRNVGETDKLIGKYPYEPLHDMRRAWDRIDPDGRVVAPEDMKAARDKIWTAFGALRERFLEELDLEEPARPLIERGAARVKKEGSSLG